MESAGLVLYYTPSGGLTQIKNETLGSIFYPGASNKVGDASVGGL